MDIDLISDGIIGACVEVHRHLGPGFVEGAYDEAVAIELRLRGLPFVRQVRVPVVYKGRALEHHYGVDFVVASAVALELKATERIAPLHHAQIRTYLRMTALTVGLLVSFSGSTLREGIKRVSNSELIRPRRSGSGSWRLLGS